MGRESLPEARKQLGRVRCTCGFIGPDRLHHDDRLASEAKAHPLSDDPNVGPNCDPWIEVRAEGKRPVLLDLFCGAGGAAMGYRHAGFEVIGVDIKPQPRYPFEFIQADAISYLGSLVYGVEHLTIAAIHASPPCQRYSDLAKRNGNAADHPDLIGPVRELLEQTGLPWVIENVEGAPLRDPGLICGSERLLLLPDFSYRLRRHRLFETNWGFNQRGCGCHRDSLRDIPVLDVSGGGPSHAPRLDGAGGRTYKGTADQVREIMGMPWATKAECNEAVPPAYTYLLGGQLFAEVKAGRTKPGGRS